VKQKLKRYNWFGSILKLGMMPLAMGTGIGAELRNACGVASVGGIFISGVLTLFVMPVMYNLFTHTK